MVDTQTVVNPSALSDAGQIGQDGKRLIPYRLWLFALVIAVCTSLPYVMGWFNTPEGWGYSGAPFVPDGIQWDYYVYIASMGQGLRGEWNYHLPFTHEPHIGLPLVHTSYVLLGAIAGLFSLSLPLVFHLSRFVLTIMMVVSVWLFAARFYERPLERWLCTVLGTLMSGASWLLLVLAPQMTRQTAPIEFWLIDAFNLFGAFYMPHFAAAVILQIVIFLSYDAWVRKRSGRSLFLLTAALAAESSIQPYMAVLFGAVLGLLTLYHLLGSRLLTMRRSVWLMIPLGVHFGLVGIMIGVSNTDPIWHSFFTQTGTISPPPIYYLTGYLWLLIPALAGGYHLLRYRPVDSGWLIPVLWVIVVMILVYAPLPSQRRYLLGVQTPLAVLAAYGIIHALLPRLRRRTVSLTVVSLYVTVGAAPLLAILVANLAAAAKPLENSSVYYQTDEQQALTALDTFAGQNDLVLTVFDLEGHISGGKVGAAIPQRVYLGHWAMTAFADQKLSLLRRFYDVTTPDSWRQDFLKETGAKFIWYDEDSKAQGDWNPAGADYLETVFESDRVTLYRVLQEAESRAD
jgi:hypothetical protein